MASASTSTTADAMDAGALLATPPSSARTKVPAPGSGPSSSSPAKPRLLWRGALHLADGTALPGIAIVSTVQPAFPGMRQAEVASKSGGNDIPGAALNSAPLSLSAEAQDDLCLSIEMVRHAPLQVIDVVRHLQQDEDGHLAVPRTGATAVAKGQYDHQEAPRPAATSSVTFEAGGNVRLYIDPSQESTVAYFERLFCYDLGDGQPALAQREDRDTTDRQTSGDRKVCASSALLFSLDKSITKVYTAQTTLADLASDPMWRGGAPATGDARLLTSDGISTSASGSSAAMEAVVMAVKRSDSKDSLVELHVGRKIVKRPVAATDGSTSLLGAAASRQAAGSQAMRPDDPAPRTLSRIFSRSRSRNSLPNMLKAGMPTTILHAKKKSGDFALPAPVQKRKAEADANIETASNYDKRLRGDERDRRRSSSSAAQSPDLPSLESQEKPTDAARGARAQSVSSGADPAKGKHKSAPIGADGACAPQQQPTIEERNRSLVKKLVHHQLLGKGLERHDEAYLACFGPTCQGALVALRHVVKTQAIDRQQAVPIIERHLEMYL